jgi:predicted RNase H-like HicB family nuclease
MKTVHFTALIEKEGDGFVALCPELDIASQGSTVEEARAMLKEAVELFYECASEEEVNRRTGSECYIVPMECTVA